MEPRNINVFIASPGDLAEERRAFKDVIDQLNRGFGRGASVRFNALGWEDALSQVGRRSQSVINDEIDRCDVFVLVMWRRWGQKSPDAAPYSSYTEEEFYRALWLFETKGRPTIFVFLKHIDAGQIADPGEQLKKVLAFRQELEDTRKVLYHSFDNLDSFREKIDAHLVAYAQGRCKHSDSIQSLPMVPDSVRRELQNAAEEIKALRAEKERAVALAQEALLEAESTTSRAEAARDLAEAKLNERDLALAEDASRAAIEGRVEEARQKFAKVVDGTKIPRILHLSSEFFRRIGEVNEAETLLHRMLAICGPDLKTVDVAAAYNGLGLTATERSDSASAEAFHRKALEIYEFLGQKEGIAREYGNLGNVLHIRGDNEAAEDLHRKSLGINEELGIEGSVAVQLAHLGNIAKERGDLVLAERYMKRALVIQTKLNCQERIADLYGDLGVVYFDLRRLEEAETMLVGALSINETLARKRGMAIQLGHLGLVQIERGQLDSAETSIRKSLAINEEIIRPEGIATDILNLGIIRKKQRDLRAASELLSKGLSLATELNLPRLIAIANFNLGAVAHAERNIAKTRAHWNEARDLFLLLGINVEATNLQLLLKELRD